MNSIISYKIRIYPNKTQRDTINRTLGACRWIYNEFLSINIDRYKNGDDYLTGYDFSKSLTQWKKTDERYMWLNDISQKAVHEAFMDCHEAYQRFFKGKSGHPRFKTKKKNPVNSYFFIGDKVKFKGKKVVLPKLGKTRITEYNYVPKDKRVIGGTIKKENNKYYVIFRIEMEDYELQKFDIDHYHGGYGIDVGIKNYLTIANKYWDTFSIDSFLNDPIILKYEDKIKEYQRIISKKVEINYAKLLNEYLKNHDGKGPSEKYKNTLKKKSYSNKCYYLQKKINVLHRKITDYKNDMIHKLVMKLVRLKPKFFTVEDLDIYGLLTKDSSHPLHDHIAKSKFGYFYNILKYKCSIYGIEVRIANKFFASSKKCCYCGTKNKGLTLSDRMYRCVNPECLLNRSKHIKNHEIDRDMNAALNLVNLKKYTVFK